ncbi:PPE family protein [Mycobacterium lacus]|nr:PPE family protein [Mycobacterium lacus]MCV7123379.1 PPE family protein [Mycobacterium lacus]ORW01666.1 hypothetical protein AWC15_00585 [Mycobacterium lacus]
MDFGGLPPEVNSGRMYTGPGSGPMMAAASAWDDLASELTCAAAGIDSVISELTSSPWVGPASAAMAAAAQPYVAWLSATAAQAEAAGVQARAAAAAYQTAFAMTLPPPVIAANRALLTVLIATNLFGQNAPAIATTEAQYAEMWAQDAAAMYDYASSSAIASRFTPFTPPPSITSPGAGAVPQLPQQLSNRSFPWFSAIIAWLEAELAGLSPADELALAGLITTAEGFVYDGGGFTLNILQIAQLLIAGRGGATTAAASALAGPGTAGLGPGLARAGGPGVSALLGRAELIGRMSVPSSWASSPSMPSVDTAQMPGAGVHPGPPGGTASLLRGMPTRRPGRTASFAQRRNGFRPTVMPRPVAAG